MSDDGQQSLSIQLLGAGCASLSLAARAAELPRHDLTIIDPGTHSSPNHIWGFWAMPWIQNTDDTIKKRWFNWCVVAPNKSVTHSTKSHPYCALKRHDWIAKCRGEAVKSGVKFNTKMDADSTVQILDSRPPAIPSDMMLQHFAGFEVKTEQPAFDDTTAILMDFRCDQKLGMHFIYCLPFTDRHALIESTLFSPAVAPTTFYEEAIESYLCDILAVNSFSIIAREAGVIPLGVMPPHNPTFTGIGGNGGAIRPSSGYAFSFIQKQINQMIVDAEPSQPLKVKVPHSRFEIWMDHIFLAVIRNHPELSPIIFTRLAVKLSGDEFARFLSGDAGSIIWMKVIMAVPKLPFIKALFAQKWVVASS